MKKLERFILRDDSECNKLKKRHRSMPLNVIAPRLLEHFYIIKSAGASEKKLGTPALHTSMLKILFLF